MISEITVNMECADPKLMSSCWLYLWQ